MNNIAKYILILIIGMIVGALLNSFNGNGDSDAVKALVLEKEALELKVLNYTETLDSMDGILALQLQDYSQKRTTGNNIVVKWRERVVHDTDTVVEECAKDVTFLDSVLKNADKVIGTQQDIRYVTDTIIKYKDTIITKQEAISSIYKKESNRVRFQYGGSVISSSLFKSNLKIEDAMPRVGIKLKTSSINLGVSPFTGRSEINLMKDF